MRSHRDLSCSGLRAVHYGKQNEQSLWETGS
jgi:hypothetical protein